MKIQFSDRFYEKCTVYICIVYITSHIKFFLTLCFSLVLFPVGGWGCLPPPDLVVSEDRLGLCVAPAEEVEEVVEGLEETPSTCWDLREGVEEDGPFELADERAPLLDLRLPTAPVVVGIRELVEEDCKWNRERGESLTTKFFQHPTRLRC